MIRNNDTDADVLDRIANELIDARAADLSARIADLSARLWHFGYEHPGSAEISILDRVTSLVDRLKGAIESGREQGHR